MSEPSQVKRRPGRGEGAGGPAGRAQATAARLVAAARRLFLERGYAATPLTAVAAAAGVSVETLYVRFGSKRALLAALVEGVSRAGAPVDLLAAAAAEPDPRAQLRLTARAARRIYEASWDVVEILRHAGTADPAVAAAWREGDERARALQAPLVRALAGRGVLRPALTEREAADLLWALSGPDLYRLLAVERAWSGERYEQWLGDALASALLA